MGLISCVWRCLVVVVMVTVSTTIYHYHHHHHRHRMLIHNDGLDVRTRLVAFEGFEGIKHPEDLYEQLTYVDKIKTSDLFTNVLRLELETNQESEDSKDFGNPRSKTFKGLDTVGVPIEGLGDGIYTGFYLEDGEEYPTNPDDSHTNGRSRDIGGNPRTRMEYDWLFSGRIYDTVHETSDLDNIQTDTSLYNPGDDDKTIAVSSPTDSNDYRTIDVSNDSRNVQNVSADDYLDMLLDNVQLLIEEEEEEEDVRSSLRNDAMFEMLSGHRVRRSVGSALVTKVASTSERNNTGTPPSIEGRRDPSCRDRCGQRRDTPCSCHYTCFVLRVCCEDVRTQCPSLEHEARAVLGNDLVDVVRGVTCDAFTNRLVVDKCVWPKEPMLEPLTTTDDDFVSTIRSMAVVYDQHTGLVFRNSSVYRCYMNGSHSLSPWSARFLIADDLNLRGVITNPTTALGLMQTSKVKFSPPSDSIAGHACFSLVHTCKKELTYLDPDQRCGEFVSHYSSLAHRAGLVYGNRYCYVCNTNTTTGGQHGLRDGGNIPRSTPLSFLMDFTDTGSGLQINLELVGFKTANSWTCRVNGSSIAKGSRDRFSHSPPQCNAVVCGTSVIHKGHCMYPSLYVLVLRHPSGRGLGVGSMLRMAEFVSCYLEKGNLKHSSAEGPVVVNGAAVYRHFRSSEGMGLSRLSVDNEDEYFVVRLSGFLPSVAESLSSRRGRFMRALESAVRFWFVESGLVVVGKNGWLYYGGQEDGDGVGGDEGGDDENDNESKAGPRQYGRNVLLAAIVASLAPGRIHARHKSPTPIESGEEITSVGVDRETLWRCGFEGMGWDVRSGVGRSNCRVPGVLYYVYVMAGVVIVGVVWVGSG